LGNLAARSSPLGDRSDLSDVGETAMLRPKVAAANASRRFARIFHNPLGAQGISRKGVAAFDGILLNQKG
jgi:hypothetical protein